MIKFIANGTVDSYGAALSSLCMVHCLALPLAGLVALPIVGHHSPLEEILHPLILLLALPLAATAFVRARRIQNWASMVALVSGATLITLSFPLEVLLQGGETGMTFLGGLSLVVGHVGNLRCTKDSTCKRTGGNS